MMPVNVMKADAFFTAATETTKVNSEDDSRRSKQRWQLNLLGSASAASLTFLFGLILAVASLLDLISPSGNLSIAGSVLLAVSFPLMVMTAHCLDKIDDTNRSARVRELRKKMFR